MVGQYGIASYTSTTAIGGTIVPGTITNTLNGVTTGISMAMGTMTGTGTIVLTLRDSLGASVFAGTQVESGTSYVGTVVLMRDRNMSWVVTPSGTQDAANVFSFNVHFQQEA